MICLSIYSSLNFPPSADNKILGSIAGISLKDILYCLENGYLIFGIIEEINDGSCILVIRCNGKA